jgi:glycoside/pentoside/hexuronide:cation symporter, GPH family
MSNTSAQTSNSKVSTVRPFGWRDKIGYLMGDFGCNMSFSLISSYMFIFFTQYIGISLIHYATIILISKIFDGINDPIVGALVDRLTPKKGDKFRPWIFWGSFPLAASAIIMFIDTTSWAYGAKLALCIASYVIWDICYTLVNVPYGSMNSVITSDPIERSQLSTYRTFGGIVAFVPLGVLIPMFAYKKQMINGVEKSVFQGSSMFTIALVLGVIALISFQILYRWSVERIPHKEHDGENFNYFKTLKGFFTNRAVLGLTIATFAQTVFIASATQLGQMNFQLYFGNGKLSSLGMITYLVPMIVMGPLIKPLVKKFGKKEISAYPLLGSIAVNVLLLILPIKNPMVWIGFQLVGAIFGMGNAMVGWAMLSDAIDYLELKTGRREEGSVYATYSMVRKIGQGVGQALVPALIAMVIPGIVMNNAATWNADYAVQIKNLTVMFPMVGNIIMFICYAFIYNLDKKTIDNMQVKLGRTKA